MNNLTRIKQEFEYVHKIFEASPTMQKILSGEIAIEHSRKSGKMSNNSAI